MANNAPPEVISFRLPKRLNAKLGEAADLVGMSRGTYARLVLIEALTNTDQARMRDELNALREAVQAIQRNLEVAVVALLVDAGKAGPDEAEAFVRQRMARPQPAGRPANVGGAPCCQSGPRREGRASTTSASPARTTTWPAASRRAGGSETRPRRSTCRRPWSARRS